MLRLFGFLVTATIIAGAVLTLDYTSVRKAAAAAEQPVPDFPTYLSNLRPRLVSMISPSAAPAGPAPTTDLAQMLPRAPDGWTVRPTERNDEDGFLPKDTDKLDKDVKSLIASIAKGKGPRGSDAEALFYETDGKTVIVKAVRYPDKTFADPTALAAHLKDRLPVPKRDYLRVRGLDVFEGNLPDGLRSRLFYAEVGAQIRVWVLASRKTTDKDLIALFETLDVKAMNAAVIDREEGLGEIPVMVLVSELDEAGLAAYEADREARENERAARRLAVFGALADKAAPPATEATETPTTVTCTKGAGGVKRCTVAD